MKKFYLYCFLFVLFVLALQGCGRSDSPVSVQNKQNNGRTLEPASSHVVVDQEAIMEHIYQTLVLKRSSRGTITEEPEKTAEPEVPEEVLEPVASTPIRYTSRKDGFNILMPFTPTVTNLKPTKSIDVRIYQANVHDGSIKYSVFCHSFEKKILSDELVRIYLDSSLPDRLVGADKGQVIRKVLTKFRGFDAKEFEHISIEGDAEFVYKGIVFLIDGDSISLTMVHPRQIKPKLTFDRFTESFELLPLEPIPSPDDWEDERLGLRFTPPADMSNLNRERGGNGLIAMFANEAGHTIGILDATVAYPGITWSDIHQKLSEMKDCGDGFYEKVIAGTATKHPTVQLLRCVGNDTRIYLIQAYAPQKTYFRSLQKFKASMKSLSFDK